MIDNWSTASEVRQPGQGETVSFYRKVPCDVHKCTTIDIVHHIANPIYHNARTIITQICNENIVIIQFQ